MTWKLSGLLVPILLMPFAGAPGNAASAPARTGAIEGVVVVREKPARRTVDRYGGRAVARTIQPIPPVVYLKGPVGSAPEPLDDVTMAQEDTAFVPALLVVPVGTTVRFPNQDPFFHNVFSYSRAGRFDLGRYPRGESKEVLLDRPGVVKVYCEVHEPMRSAIVVVENEYWAEPDPDGRFRIEAIPAGTYTLVAWHADQGELEREVRVPEDGVVRVEMEL